MKRILSIVVICLLCIQLLSFTNSSVSEKYTTDYEMNEWLFPNKEYNTQDYYRNDPALFIDDKYMSYYFFNLKQNFGNNIKGSCSHVAISMLLSYYDTYWNDSIIDSDYDVYGTVQDPVIICNTDSPGIRTEYMNGSAAIVNSNMSALDYANVASNYSNLYFHLYLIDVGKNSLGLYDTDDDSTPCGVTDSELYTLLNYYIYDVKGYTTDEILVNKIDASNIVGTNVRDYTINSILQGKPVLLMMSSLFNGGHAFIAYDYDSAHDEIYCHWGWDASHLGYPYEFEHIALSTTGMDIYVSAITIDINENSLPHNHPLNYESSTGESYCSCYFPCHPEHECTYEMYNENQHIYTCGHVANENNKSVHQLEYIDVFGNDTSHIVRCAQCNYSYTATHNYSCEYVDVNTHTGVCVDCGYEATLSHTYDKYKSVDAFYHKSACSCGATTGGNLGHIWTSSNIIGYAECKMCKYLKSSAGGNIAIIKEKPPVIEEVTE